MTLEDRIHSAFGRGTTGGGFGAIPGAASAAGRFGKELVPRRVVSAWMSAINTDVCDTRSWLVRLVLDCRSAMYRWIFAWLA